MSRVIENDQDEHDDLPEFCHHEEMKNFSIFLFLQHQGAMNGKIGGNDPCEDTITAISPKVFCLLMLAEDGIIMTPIGAHPVVGISLAFEMPFGQACVYNKASGCWSSEEEGSAHLGFSFVFKEMGDEKLQILRSKFPHFEIRVEPISKVVNVVSAYKLDPSECYLSDVRSAFCRWLSEIVKAEEALSMLAFHTSVNKKPTILQ